MVSSVKKTLHFLHCKNYVHLEDCRRQLLISHRGHAFGILYASAPTSALAWDRTRAALARSKALNHDPVVAAYFCQVWRAVSSTYIYL